MGRTKGSKNKKVAKTQYDIVGKRIINEDRRIQNRLNQQAKRSRIKEFEVGFKAGRQAKKVATKNKKVAIDLNVTPTRIRKFFKTKLKADLTPSLQIEELRSLYVGAMTLHHSVVKVQKKKNSEFVSSYVKTIKSAFDAVNKGGLRKSLELFVMANVRRMFSVESLLNLQNSALTNSLNYQDIDLLARLTRVDNSGAPKAYMRGLIPSRATLQRASDHLSEGMDELISSVVCFDNKMCKLNVNDVIDELLIACDMGKYGRSREQIEAGDIPTKEIKFIFGCDESHLYEHSHFSNSVVRLANCEMLDKLFGSPWVQATELEEPSRTHSTGSVVALDIDTEVVPQTEDVMVEAVLPPEKRTWHKIHSVMACILLGFVHGREKLESMKVLLSDIFAQLKVWGGQKRTYYCKGLDLHFNCKGICVNDMAQNWLVTQSGGGSHSTEFLCYCCWKTSSMRGRPSPYRCIDCINEDRRDPTHREFDCHHVDILESDHIVEIESCVDRFMEGREPFPPTSHWFAYCLVFPLGAKHLRMHREAFVMRYLQYPITEIASLIDEELKTRIRTWQMTYEVTYESCMTCSLEVLEENLKVRKIREEDEHWQNVLCDATKVDAQLGIYLPSTEEHKRLLLKYCLMMTLKVGWVTKNKRQNSLFYVNELNPPCGMHFETRVQLGFDEALLNESKSKLSESALKKFFEERVDPLINEAFVMGDRIPDDVFLLRDDKMGAFRCQILNSSITEFKLTAVKTRKLNLRMKGPRGLISLIRSCGSDTDVDWNRRFDLYNTIFDDLRTYFSIWHDSSNRVPDEGFIRDHTLAADRICRNWWLLHGVTKFGNYMEHIESGHTRQFMRWHGSQYDSQNQNLEGMMKLTRSFARNRTGGNSGKGGGSICIAESVRKFLLTRLSNQRAQMIQTSTGTAITQTLSETRLAGKAAVGRRGSSNHKNMSSHARREYVESTESSLTNSSMLSSMGVSSRRTDSVGHSEYAEPPVLQYASTELATPIVSDTVSHVELQRQGTDSVSPTKRTRLLGASSRPLVRFQQSVGEYGANVYTRVNLEFIRDYAEYPSIGDVIPTCEENMALKLECTDDICSLTRLECVNRRMQQDSAIASSLFTRRKDGSRGYGLETLQSVTADAFIMEYCGVVIGEARCKEVLRRAVVKQKENARSYVMSLQCSTRRTGALYIDAHDTQHPSKYINHSCEPNCFVERWLVMGIPRIGVFALRNIAVGEMLTFDYGWKAASDWPTQPCYCGAATCRRTLQKVV